MRCHTTVRAGHNCKAVKDTWYTILLTWNISEALIWLKNLKYEQQVDCFEEFLTEGMGSFGKINLDEQTSSQEALQEMLDDIEN